ncbi:basic helix-loop-helix family protein [Arabidopsis lyrata subsp. lyrata]|uniref:Basic helix-loop-helix family protein n=1 Tax=Arabidopsis lyrata subsp. lyrata TaxID=81972 RepID=D7LSR1_ARALL|nr:basic helix-loop-helix family protein [Arabidopsis lyrata subsp. lyrata]
MKRFQGHINPCFFDRKPDVRSLEVQGFAEAQSFAFKEEEEESLQDTVPFLQMLQSEDPSSFFSIKEPNFLTLLSLQTLKEPWELESFPESDSPRQSETNCFYQKPSMEGANQALSSQEPFLSQAIMTLPSSTSSPLTANSRRKRKINHLLPQEMTREKRKRRKTKPSKNIEEIENQRINHIAVERNRRRQMNEHINSLRALLPPSYIQRGDQASIVGGAINYVKVLEQIIQSLESQKRTQQESSEVVENAINHLSGISSNALWTTQEDQTYIPKIEATVIQNHVSLKVQCPKKQGQLLKGIISLEKLKLTVLHLNITTSSHSSVSYSFNLKMEDECELESADEITAAVHQIFDIPTI